MSQPLLYDRLGRQVTYLRMSSQTLYFRYLLHASGRLVLGRYDLLTYENCPDRKGVC